MNTFSGLFKLINHAIKEGRSESEKSVNHATLKVDSVDKLNEIFNIDSDVAEAIGSSKGSLDPGAVITRNLLTGKMTELPNNASITVSAYAIDNLSIPDNKQLKLKKDQNHVISVNTLTLGHNSSIISEHSILNLSVGKILRGTVPEDAPLPQGINGEFVNGEYTCDFGIYGSKGNTGIMGAQGDSGTQGDRGSDAQCGPGGGTPIGGYDAVNGGNGGNGSDGCDGHNGENGKPSLTTIITLAEIDRSVGSISVRTISGAGGDGGNGGNGGNGGAGGKGGNGQQCGCTGMDAASGGDGGNGGNGGNGGDGGNGVNGELITIKIKANEYFNKSNVIVSSEQAPAGNGGKPGNGGKGGAAGLHGDAGHKYSNAGRDGKEGLNGKPGEEGESGKEVGLPAEVRVLTF